MINLQTKLKIKEITFHLKLRILIELFFIKG